MKLNENKKIVILGLILLIVAGMIVVALKGFNVSLMLSKHESINFTIGKEFNIKDVESICKEVFNDKKFVIRKVELFDDAVNINALSITDDEKQNLVNKMNEKYETSYTADDINVSNISNIRIRDLIKIYVKPFCISGAIICLYILIRFRKINSFKVIGKLLCILLFTEAIIASTIAITRIPVSALIINLMTCVALIELIIYINKIEKDYLKFESEQ